MQTQCAGDIPLETSHTNAHVAGIAQLLEQRSQCPDDHSHQNDARLRRKGFLVLSTFVSSESRLIMQGNYI